MAADKFEDQLKQALRESEEELDAASLSRLHQARSHAVEQLDKKPPLYKQPWLWSGATAAILVMALMITVIPEPPIEPESDLISAFEDGPQQDMDLFENLEFYEWLAAQESS